LTVATFIWLSIFQIVIHVVPFLNQLNRHSWYAAQPTPPSIAVSQRLENHLTFIDILSTMKAIILLPANYFSPNKTIEFD
jgi:hypothetical protein